MEGETKANPKTSAFGANDSDSKTGSDIEPRRGLFRGAWHDSKGEWHVTGGFEDKRFGGMFPEARRQPPKITLAPQSPVLPEKPLTAKPKRPSEAELIEHLNKLEELYQAFYGRFTKAGKLAPELSPLIRELEIQARGAGAKTSDIESRREQAIRLSGYASLLSPEQSSVASSRLLPRAAEAKPESEKKRVVGVILQSGEVLSVRPEDVSVLARLLTELEQRRIQTQESNQKEDSLLVVEINQVRDILMQLKVAGMLTPLEVSNRFL